MSYGLHFFWVHDVPYIDPIFGRKIIIIKYTVNAEFEEEIDILKMEKLGQLQQIKQIYNFLTTHNLEEISKKLGLGKCPTPLSFY